ncbi:MAG: glycosyltransferase family 2 protein [Alphaproteobacteria bacterium]
MKQGSGNPAAKSRQGASRDDVTSVIVVNFNAGQYLCAAVESVLAQETPVEIIVVDNRSTDGSVENLTAQIVDRRLHVIRLERNFGFAHACNAGIAKATGSTFLMFNPDCRMAHGALQTLRLALSAGDKLGMAGPLLVNPDGTEQRGGRRDIPNPWQIFCMTLQLHRLMPNHPRFRSINQHDQPIPDQPVSVQAISGACMLVKRSAVEKVGTLDRAFFMHFEDLDWCLRFSQAGFGIVFVPQAVVEHTQGVCSRGRVRRVAYHKHRSLLTFLDKHFTQFYPTLFMALVSCAVTIRFFLVALTSLFNTRTLTRDPWDSPVRLSGTPGEKRDGRKPGERESVQ